MSRASLEKKPYDVATMFDGIARRYDLANAVMTAGQVNGWRRATVEALSPRPGERILDLAAGTGTSSSALAAEGADVVASDFSPGMIAEGRRRYPDLEFVQADATDLPFGDGEFDAVTISYGLRNIQDADSALREMLRVTRPGGRLVVCEFSTPVNPVVRTVYMEYLMKALPHVANLATRKRDDSYRYLAESIAAWPDQRTLRDRIEGVGWSGVQHRNLSGGIVALHRGWKPAA